METEASSAMVSLIMRLSEVELRPLFLHLCEWKAAIAAEDGSKEATLGGLDRRLSFYRVLDGLSAALKVGTKENDMLCIYIFYIRYVRRDRSIKRSLRRQLKFRGKK